MVPNHALIILALLYGDDDFRRSLMIVNTAGWDTDCNSGNVGCLLGIKNGLAGDRRLRLRLARAGGRPPVPRHGRWRTRHHRRGARDLRDRQHRPRPGGGAAPARRRTAPASTSSCRARCRASGADHPSVTVENVEGHSETGSRALAVRWIDERPDTPGRCRHPDVHPAGSDRHAGLHAAGIAHALSRAGGPRSPGSPPRQRRSGRGAADDPLTTGATTRCAASPARRSLSRPAAPRRWPGAFPTWGERRWPRWGSRSSRPRRAPGAVYLDWLTWDGAPDVTLGRPEGGEMWRRAWVDGVDQFQSALAAAVPALAEPRHRADQPGHRRLGRLPRQRRRQRSSSPSRPGSPPASVACGAGTRSCWATTAWRGW